VWQSIINWCFDPSSQTLIIGMLLSFIAGIAVSKIRTGADKHLSLHNTKENDEAFFRAIQYIISSNHDRAIEEFTKSIKINSDVIETYVALGNLFRAKGDIGKAIRIRQSIILRQNIDEHIKTNALLDMGLDYRSGGFLDRALKIFTNVLKKDPSNLRALEETKKIYEDMKEWEHAYKILQKISRISNKNYNNILAHHLVEIGKIQQERGNTAKAISLFNRAISVDNGCVDAYLHLGDIYFEEHKHKKAISTWKKIAEFQPRFTYLAYQRLEQSYSLMRNLRPVEDFLKQAIQTHPDVFAHMALAQYYYNSGNITGALSEITNALTLDPCFWGAVKLKGEILLKHKRDDEALMAYKELIKNLDLPYINFRCSHCGFQASELSWQCPQCKKWDTIYPTNIHTFETDSVDIKGEPFPQLKDITSKTAI